MKPQSLMNIYRPRSYFWRKVESSPSSIETMRMTALPYLKFQVDTHAHVSLQSLIYLLCCPKMIAPCTVILSHIPNASLDIMVDRMLRGPSLVLIWKFGATAVVDIRKDPVK